MDIYLIVALVAGYVLLGSITGWLVQRDTDTDDAVILIAAFFWPIAIVLFMLGLLCDKVEETRLPPLNQHPTARVIESLGDRHQPAGDPEHWGSE